MEPTELNDSSERMPINRIVGETMLVMDKFPEAARTIYLKLRQKFEGVEDTEEIKQDNTPVV